MKISTQGFLFITYDSVNFQLGLKKLVEYVKIIFS